MFYFVDVKFGWVNSFDMEVEIGKFVIYLVVVFIVFVLNLEFLDIGVFDDVVLVVMVMGGFGFGELVGVVEGIFWYEEFDFVLEGFDFGGYVMEGFFNVGDGFVSSVNELFGEWFYVSLGLFVVVWENMLCLLLEWSCWGDFEEYCWSSDFYCRYVWWWRVNLEMVMDGGRRRGRGISLGEDS